MKRTLFFFALIACFASCKNNGGGTASAKAGKKEAAPSIASTEIIVGAKRKPAKPDFQVVEMVIENNLLKVVFQYSGGCEEHDFYAHFSGGWLKSLPPQAVLDFEHLNPSNDACRSLVKDTVFYSLDSVKYPGGNEVVIKTTLNKKLSSSYTY